MLDEFYKDPAIIQDMRTGPLGSHLDSFSGLLSGDGYARYTIRIKLGLLRDLSCWLAENGLGIVNLDDAVMNQFLKECRKRRPLRNGELQTADRFLDHLRTEGVIPHPESCGNLSPLETLLRQYEVHLREDCGFSPGTITGYCNYSRTFIEEQFGDGPINLGDLSAGDVSGFVLRHAHRLGAWGTRSICTALRSFFRFLFQEGRTTDLTVTVPTVPKWQLAEVPKYLESEQIEQIIQVCDQGTPVGRRDRAIILLMARLGLRAAEVVALELGDINWRAGELTVRGKGGTRDRLPLPQDVGEALVIYLCQDRPDCRSCRVFIRMRAPFRGLSRSCTVGSIVSRTLNKTGLDPPFKGTHLFRHSLATAMLRQGAPLAEVSQILRHRLVSTTEIYAKVDTKGLRSLVRPWPIVEETDE